MKTSASFSKEISLDISYSQNVAFFNSKSIDSLDCSHTQALNTQLSLVNTTIEDVLSESDKRQSLILPLAFCLSLVSFLLLPINQKTLGESLLDKIFYTSHTSTLNISRSYVAKRPIPLKINPNYPLADKIIHYMKAEGYQVFVGKGNYNIVYIEGMSLDEIRNHNQPNMFNDLRLVIEVIDGKPRIVNKWEATTEPGIYYTENPQDTMGAFRIKPGQYTAWEIGYHWGSGGDTQEGLVQTKKVLGYRDLYKHYKREGKLYAGLFDINQHNANNSPFDNIGYYGAGCLVGRTREGHKEFMALIKRDARYQKDPGFVFTTTVILADSL